jgi:hypothetical protein
MHRTLITLATFAMATSTLQAEQSTTAELTELLKNPTADFSELSRSQLEAVADEDAVEYYGAHKGEKVNISSLGTVRAMAHNLRGSIADDYSMEFRLTLRALIEQGE